MTKGHRKTGTVFWQKNGQKKAESTAKVNSNEVKE